MKKESRAKKHPLSSFALKTKRSTGLLVIAFLLFNYPLILFANKMQRVMGLPVLYLYLFIIWLVVIVVSSLVLNQLPSDKHKTSEDNR